VTAIMFIAHVISLC